jgi:hypothetical protein
VAVRVSCFQAVQVAIRLKEVAMSGEGGELAHQPAPVAFRFEGEASQHAIPVDARILDWIVY